MVGTPIDIVKVLTAAAPIVASVASMVNANKSENIKKEENKEPKINVTINNNFYTNSEKEAVVAATQVQKQVIDGTSATNTRYLI